MKKLNKVTVRTDCNFYRGDKPCIPYIKSGILCDKCSHYKKISSNRSKERRKLLSKLLEYAHEKSKDKKLHYAGDRFAILIIKLGAAGDVLRTTPILKTLKKTFPSCYIIWITDRDCVELLENNPYIDRLMRANLVSARQLLNERFNLVLSFDKAAFAVSLATAVRADTKRGFAIDRSGGLNVFNKASLYALRLGVDNKLKYRNNRKSYQKIIYDMAEIKAPYGTYILPLEEDYSQFGKKVLLKHGVKTRSLVVGFNTGSGRVFPTKKWPIDYFVKLALMLKRLKNVSVILLGGKQESHINRTIEKRTGGKAVNIGTGYSKKDFIGIIGNCDIIVTADTLCMHLGVARKKRVLALFGPTTEREVDLYGYGEKLSSIVECSPCYKSRCSDTICMKSIAPDKVYEKIKRMASRR